MSGWDVDDRRDWGDYQDEARSEARSEARREAQLDEWLKTAVRCADCDFTWSRNWDTQDEHVRTKLRDNPGACPVCGSMRKART